MIYATQFNGETKQCTSTSENSGFMSIEQVVELMGDEYVSRGPRVVIYGDGVERVAYSDFKFHVDTTGNSA